MELSNEEKQAILAQRVKQFAVEKYGHQINKELLIKRKADAPKEAETELETEIAKVDVTINEIEKVIQDTKSIAAELPTEAPVEAEAEE